MLDCLDVQGPGLKLGEVPLPNVAVSSKGPAALPVISRPSLESVQMDTLDTYLSKIS